MKFNIEVRRLSDPKGESIEYKAEKAVSIGDILEELGLESYLTFVNESFQNHSYVLKEGDALILIPDTTGG